MRRVIIYVIMLCMMHFVSAQIRIIPQAQLEAANPRVVSSSLKLVPQAVDFGTIDEMSGVWQGVAEVVNIGSDTIAVTRVKSTCGCLQVELPKRVLAPNERVKVGLKYYPRGHAGVVRQRVLLYTAMSGDAPTAILQLRGVVAASADRSDDYPYVRGVLRLRQEQVKFYREGQQTLRIACMNGGSTPLQPTVDVALLPKGLKVRFEPIELAPKQEGDMVIEYDGNGALQGEQPLYIFIKGLNLPPRQSRVEVLFGN